MNTIAKVTRAVIDRLQSLAKEPQEGGSTSRRVIAEASLALSEAGALSPDHPLAGALRMALIGFRDFVDALEHEELGNPDVWPPPEYDEAPWDDDWSSVGETSDEGDDTETEEDAFEDEIFWDSGFETDDEETTSSTEADNVRTPELADTAGITTALGRTSDEASDLPEWCVYNHHLPQETHTRPSLLEEIREYIDTLSFILPQRKFRSMYILHDSKTD